MNCVASNNRSISSYSSGRPKRLKSKCWQGPPLPEALGESPALASQLLCLSAPSACGPIPFCSVFTLFSPPSSSSPSACSFEGHFGTWAHPYTTTITSWCSVVKTSSSNLGLPVWSLVRAVTWCKESACNEGDVDRTQDRSLIPGDLLGEEMATTQFFCLGNSRQRSLARCSL